MPRAIDKLVWEGGTDKKRERGAKKPSPNDKKQRERENTRQESPRGHAAGAFFVLS
jgi:hypothetical protein